MTFEEIEKEIRRRIEGKKLKRGDYATCLVGALGGIAAVIDWLGETQTIALEWGFEGYGMGASAEKYPDYYALGQKIAKENGL